jgi:hypothetical protein
MRDKEDDAVAAAADLATADPEPAAESGHGYNSQHLLEFWPDAPAAWFLQAESLKCITAQSDKYNHLVSALQRATAWTLWRILMMSTPTPLSKKSSSPLKS